MTNADPLIQALIDCESRLRAWLGESALNADLFQRDPLTAFRTANLGVNEHLLRELEEIVIGIVQKFKAE
jgi:hypothetical protein